jgi:pyruvate formate lyase activating enzyme
LTESSQLIRCPFCINRQLVIGDTKESIDASEIITRLSVRNEKWVVVSGGEPFLCPNVDELFKAIRDFGMKVAVATNGSYPDRLEKMGNQGIIDHVVMDIKAKLDPESYSKASGKNMSKYDVDKVLRSIEYLRDGPLYCFVREV